MTLWVVFIAMTGLAVAGLLVPLMRRPGDRRTRADYDLAVYRDQLSEVEKDLARGLLSASEAGAARTEIERRMLATGDGKTETRSATPRRQSVILAIAILVPAGAMLLYNILGAPDLPGQPYAERARSDPAFALVAEMQKEMRELQAHPNAAGYRQLGDLYFEARRYGMAADTYRAAAALQPRDAKIWSALGESLTLAQGGGVTADAQEAFGHAFALDPRDARAEFYLGLAAAQTNDLRRAVAIWRHLRESGPADAPWAVMVDEHIRAYAAKGGFDARSVPASPPGVK